MEPLDERARFRFGGVFGVLWLVLLVNPLQKARAEAVRLAEESGWL